jgi:hypothetical protein
LYNYINNKTMGIIEESEHLLPVGLNMPPPQPVTVYQPIAIPIQLPDYYSSQAPPPKSEKITTRGTILKEWVDVFPSILEGRVRKSSI